MNICTFIPNSPVICEFYSFTSYLFVNVLYEQVEQSSDNTEPCDKSMLVQNRVFSDPSR